MGTPFSASVKLGQFVTDPDNDRLNGNVRGWFSIFFTGSPGEVTMAKPL